MLAKGMLYGLLATALASAACGGDDDDAATPDATVAVDAAAIPDAPPPSPGLTIQGAFVVRNAANIEVDANDRVDIELRIERGGAPVTNAIVRINPPMSFETFLTGDPLDLSLYTGNYMGYNNNTARIEIDSDADEVPKTILVGQPLFKVTNPPPATTVLPGDDLVVDWNRPGAAATTARVRTNGGHDSGELADSNTYTIPGADITVATENDAIFVTRCRRNDSLDGSAAAGTFIDFCVESRLPFTVQID